MNPEPSKSILKQPPTTLIGRASNRKSILNKTVRQQKRMKTLVIPFTEPIKKSVKIKTEPLRDNSPPKIQRSGKKHNTSAARTHNSYKILTPALTSKEAI